MELPFTTQQFLNVFYVYNEAIWPAQWVAYSLSIVAVLLAILTPRRRHSDKIISAILAGFWIWTGAIFHLQYFTTIGPGGYLFGVLFIAQGVLFIRFGIIKPMLHYRFRGDAVGITGACVVFYTLAASPAIMWLTETQFPPESAIGANPCAVTMITFSLLLLTDSRVPKAVLVIPALWALVSIKALQILGINVVDSALLITAVVTVGMLLYRDRLRQAPLIPSAAS